MKRCFLFFAALALLAYSVHAQDGENKCGACTTPNPPPPPSPPPPSPCPPPPALPQPTPVLPPPSPKKPPTPSTPYCPPPPSSPAGMIYITGPPGQLYPIDQDFNGAHGVRSSVGLPVMLGLGLLGVLVFW